MAEPKEEAPGAGIEQGTYEVLRGRLVEQARLLLGGVEHRIADLHKQRHALDETIAELEQLQRHVTDFIRGQ